MELYVFAGGQTDSLNRWLQDLNAQFLPVYNKGKKTGLKRRLLVAPIQLYKICFAKEELNKVLSMVCPQTYITERHKILGMGLGAIRKGMGLMKCPIPKRLDPLLQPNQVDKAVAVVPVGLKKDIIDVNGVELI